MTLERCANRRASAVEEDALVAVRDLQNSDDIIGAKPLNISHRDDDALQLREFFDGVLDDLEELLLLQALLGVYLPTKGRLGPVPSLGEPPLVRVVEHTLDVMFSERGEVDRARVATCSLLGFVGHDGKDPGL